MYSEQIAQITCMALRRQNIRVAASDNKNDTQARRAAQ
jgi:hypothetical protein